MEDLQKIIDETEFYHSIETNNFKIKGYYNWEPYFSSIKDLFDLKGKKVLDVGPADGYFSHKFCSLGAFVEAVDIPSQIDRDHYNYGEVNKSFNHWKKKVITILILKFLTKYTKMILNFILKIFMNLRI